MLDHFLQFCAVAELEPCAFAEKNYSLTRQKWGDLLDRLAEGPIELRSPAGLPSTGPETLVGQVSDGMDIVWALGGQRLGVDRGAAIAPRGGRGVAFQSPRRSDRGSSGLAA